MPTCRTAQRDHCDVLPTKKVPFHLDGRRARGSSDPTLAILNVHMARRQDGFGATTQLWSQIRRMTWENNHSRANT